MNKFSVALSALVLAGSFSAVQAADAVRLVPNDTVKEAKIVIPNPDTVAKPPQVVDGLPVPTAQKDAPYVVLTRPIPNSKKSYDLYLIQTHDEILVPMAVRKPEGNGPFPAILIGSGNGTGGFMRLDNIMYRTEPMIDRMVERGYVVAYGNYRAMAFEGFNHAQRPSRWYDTISGGPRVVNTSSSLDSDDYISMIQQLQGLPFVKSDAVGSIGISHSGELLTEAAMYTKWAVGVNVEGASWELLQVDLEKAPRDGRNMLLPDTDMNLVRSLVNVEESKERLKKIDMPILHMGRPKDEMSGLFRLAYDLQKEVGANVEWVEFDHPRHGYPLLYRKADGSFQPDPIEEEAFKTWMAYMDKHLKPAKSASAQ